MFVSRCFAILALVRGHIAACVYLFVCPPPPSLPPCLSPCLLTCPQLSLLASLPPSIPNRDLRISHDVVSLSLSFSLSHLLPCRINADWSTVLSPSACLPGDSYEFTLAIFMRQAYSPSFSFSPAFPPPPVGMLVCLSRALSSISPYPSLLLCRRLSDMLTAVQKAARWRGRAFCRGRWSRISIRQRVLHLACLRLTPCGAWLMQCLSMPRPPADFDLADVDTVS